MRSSSPVKAAKPGSRHEQSRARLLAAAEGAFAKDGLAGARTEAIAAAAGVNKAMLHYYFQTKEGLYAAVIEDCFQEFNRQALELLRAAGPAREVLLRYVALHFDFLSAHHQSAPLFQQFMMSRGPRAEALVRKFFQQRSEAVGRLLARGMRAGEFHRADPFHTAVSIISLIVFYFSAGPVLQMLGHPDPYGPAQLRRRRRAVLDFVRHAIFTNPNLNPSRP